MKTETHGQPGSPRKTAIRKALLASVVFILLVAVGFAGYTVISLYTSLRSINPSTTASTSSLNEFQFINSRSCSRSHSYSYLRTHST